ncbi:MAG: hypothetical protein H2050_07000 [Sphingobium sp.]|uniref:hypothetical protein n=1 Tax=Sphingobium sp. TaxID=1912891 RepID=UPI00183137B1|nr:hypothetical protein [Sphingobium sp.]MBA4754560.1 hypothetical protein [Sphingobium sp.]
MAKTTFRNSVRVAGASRTSWAGVPVLVMKASFDPTSATQILLGTLPAGSIPLGVQSLGGATGGTNPTVDIGTVASNAGIANEADADTLTLTYATGALTGVALTVDTPIYGKVGASAATGGTTTVLISYIFNDNGKQ